MEFLLFGDFQQCLIATIDQQSRIMEKISKTLDSIKGDLSDLKNAHRRTEGDLSVLKTTQVHTENRITGIESKLERVRADG